MYFYTMDWIRIKSLEHSFSSREKWPESELNEWSRRVWNMRFYWMFICGKL